MPKDDKEVNMATIDLMFKVYLKKFPLFYEILNEQIGASDIETAVQREKFGNKIEAVYALVVEMAYENDTAMSIIQTHFQTDPNFWTNTLWKA